MVTTKYRSETFISEGKTRNDVCEVFCLSTDTKPTEGIGNGSLLVEMDTSTLYAFDGENDTWMELG